MQLFAGEISGMQQKRGSGSCDKRRNGWSASEDENEAAGKQKKERGGKSVRFSLTM